LITQDEGLTDTITTIVNDPMNRIKLYLIKPEDPTKDNVGKLEGKAGKPLSLTPILKNQQPSCPKLYRRNSIPIP
jgi:hypothetical protein